MTEEEERPLLAHLPSEFLTWLWWVTEENGGSMDLGGEVGPVDIWVDDRIAFSAMSDDRNLAVITSENASSTREARAALAAGRVVKELRLQLKRQDHEFSFVLRGAHLDVVGAKLPGTVKNGEMAAILHDRIYLYEELHFVVAALLQSFAEKRTSEEWYSVEAPAMLAWVADALTVDMPPVSA